MGGDEISEGGDTMKPILFNGDMVRAILDGGKTVTRRPVGEDCRGEWKAINDVRENSEYGADVPCFLHREIAVDDTSRNIMYPKYDVGDILYVRETWADTWTPCGQEGFVYRADGEPERFPYWGNASLLKDEVWRPSIHMPREAARIFLRVTGVRVERLQEITDGGAMCEGVKMDNDDDLKQYGYKAGFKGAWDSIYSAKGYGWKQNPWVWVVDFEKVDKP